MSWSLDNLSGVAVNVINGTIQNFVQSLKDLDPVLVQLTKAGTDLPNAMELFATYPFPRTAPDAIRGDYTNLQISADLSLTDALNNLLEPTAQSSGSRAGGTPSAAIPGLGG